MAKYKFKYLSVSWLVVFWEHQGSNSNAIQTSVFGQCKANMSLLSANRSILSCRRAPCHLSRFVSLIKPPGIQDTPDRTVGDIFQNFTKTVIGGPSTYNPELYEKRREQLMKMVPKSQEELTPRRMIDSFDQGLIPLGSNNKLQDTYTTFLGDIRIGRLLEDIDIFAVHIVNKHILLSGRSEEGIEIESPFSIVTGLVDRIIFHKTIYVNQDIKMMGHVTWVCNNSCFF